MVSVLYVAFPQLFLLFFFPDGATTADNSVYAMAIRLLQFVAAYNVLDAMAIVFVGAIKGAGDTQFVLKVSMVMATLLAGLSWVAVEGLQLGIYGCWSLITVWVWILGVVVLCGGFLAGKWRSMRVIEHAPPPVFGRLFHREGGD